MKVTIKDIAKLSGVSPTTVSLVLNDQAKSVSQPTIDKIKKVANELNYKPNHIAISLVTKKTKTIGLIIPNINNPFFAEMAHVIEENVSEQGYNLILCNTNESYKKDIKYLQLLSARGVDGMLIAISPTKDKFEEDQIIQAINSLDVPVVAIDRWLSGMNCNRVSINHRKGAYIAVKHLIEQGHRSIATITGPLSVYTGRRRLVGYKEALEKYHIPINEEFIVEGDYNFESGYVGGLQVLKQNPSAIFVANDMMALGVLKACREQHKSVPEAISIVGFDNLLISSLIEIPLTTVNQPINELANQVSKMLFSKINEEQTSYEDIKLEPELIIRQSSSKVHTK